METISIRIPKETFDKVKKICGKTKQTIIGFVSIAVEEKVKKVKIK